MSGRNEEVEASLAELERYGIRGQVRDRGKHLEVFWAYSDGRVRAKIVARSGSDHRGPLNARGEVRRQLRADNIQIPTPEVVVLQKAFSLPSPNDSGAVRLARLERDFDSLLDLVIELQDKLARARVVSTLSFEPVVVPAQLNDTQPKSSPRVGEGPSSKILAALANGAWKARQDIAKETGVAITNVSSTLNYLAHKRQPAMVECGQRGLWRKVPSVSLVAVPSETG